MGCVFIFVMGCDLCLSCWFVVCFAWGGVFCVEFVMLVWMCCFVGVWCLVVWLVGIVVSILFCCITLDWLVWF